MSLGVLARRTLNFSFIEFFRMKQYEVQDTFNIQVNYLASIGSFGYVFCSIVFVLLIPSSTEICAMVHCINPSF